MPRSPYRVHRPAQTGGQNWFQCIVHAGAYADIWYIWFGWTLAQQAHTSVFAVCQSYAHLRALAPSYVDVQLPRYYATI